MEKENVKKNNKRGFAISSLLYPAFILIITIIIVIIILVVQTNYNNNKLNDEISNDLSDNNTMKSLKDNVEIIFIMVVLPAPFVPKSARKLF